MSEEYIYQDITELKTPVGSFRVFSSEGNIPFSVKKMALIYHRKFTTKTSMSLIHFIQKLIIL